MSVTDQAPKLPRLLDIKAIFFVVTGISLFLTGGGIRSADYLTAFSVTRNMVDSGSVVATPIEGFETWAVNTGSDGRPYCRYGIGHSLMGLPAGVIAKVLAPIWPKDTRPFDLVKVRFDQLDDLEGVIAGFLAVATNSWLLGALASVLMAISAALGMDRKQAILAAFIGSVGAPVFFQGSDFTAEPASALALALTALALVRVGAATPRKALVLALCAGLALGSAVALKVAHAVWLPVGAVAVAFAVGTWSPKRLLAVLAVFSVGVVPGLLAVLAYNMARFGTPFETGYGHYVTRWDNPLFEGLLGQLASPGRGLFVYFPAALLSLFGVVELFRRNRAVAVLAFGVIGVSWLMYSTWFAWDGGWTYGPRLLSPGASLLAIPAVLALGVSGGIVAGVASRLVTSLSMIGSLTGFAVDYIDYHFLLWKIHPETINHVIRWSIDDAPLVAYWSFPIHRQLLFNGMISNGLPWPLVVHFGIAVVMVMVGLGMFLSSGEPKKP